MNSNIFGINFQDKPEEVTKILEEKLSYNKRSQG